MIHRRPIKLRGQFGLDSSEAQSVHTMRDSGLSRDETIAAWQNLMKSTPESAAIQVDYYLGNVGAEEILKYLSPKRPQSIEFMGKVGDGYLLKAHGEGAEFDILLMTPSLPETTIQTLIANHQDDLCWLAYRNAHENTYAPRQLESGDIATPIMLDDVKTLIP
ncbi:hypothetical protein JJD84_11470 [Pseudomonas fluorescens]|nr:hypothetical protein [Pseudomonas fluorescens]